MRRTAAHQRVAICCRTRADFSADAAARSGLVVNNDRGAQRGTEFLSYQSAQHVGCTARRKGHDVGDRFAARPALGKCGQCSKTGDGGSQCGVNQGTALHGGSF